GAESHPDSPGACVPRSSDARPLAGAAGRLLAERAGAGRRRILDPRRARLMSVSTFMGLQTALRGLLAQQRALDVTGHNIANVGTEGYSRQLAVMTASPSLLEPGVGQLGTGVDITEYRRMRDDLVDVQLRAETMKKGYAEA